MSLAVASILAEGALRHPGRTAVTFGAERISYADLWREARAYGAQFRRLGVGAGDRVALLLLNTPDFPRAYYGALAIGAVVVPVHALLTPPEIAFVLRDSASRVLVCSPALAGSGRPGAESAGVAFVEAGLPGDEPIAMFEQRSEQDEAIILYTSGTTGSPKGAVLTQSNILMNCSVAAQDLFGATADDIFLAALPLFHAFGQTCVMNTAFRVGASIVLMPRFDGEAALQLMLEHSVTIFEGVPTMYIALLDAAKNHAGRPPLRLCASGGAPLPVTVLEKFEAMFDVAVLEGYGLSETSPIASFNQLDLGRKAGTIGCGIYGVDLAVANPDIEDRIELLPVGELGEIVIRGHCVFKGYLNNPEATRAAIVDGWFRSGDLGTCDADGFFSIVDRKKDMILRGGFNVYPREVEEVLMRHPGVKQVAVIGMPHEKHGEEVVAIVVREGSGEPIAEHALIEWSQGFLAKYKYPRSVQFVEAMPLGPSGKVLKRVLRDQLQAATA